MFLRIASPARVFLFGAIALALSGLASTGRASDSLSSALQLSSRLLPSSSLQLSSAQSPHFAWSELRALLPEALRTGAVTVSASGGKLSIAAPPALIWDHGRGTLRPALRMARKHAAAYLALSGTF